MTWIPRDNKFKTAMRLSPGETPIIDEIATEDLTNIYSLFQNKDAPVGINLRRSPITASKMEHCSSRQDTSHCITEVKTTRNNQPLTNSDDLLKVFYPSFI
jgi:hypothetical protein